jgi:hypothetical protein
MLRTAFADTMKDPAFLDEAKKANIDITPADGAELEQNVKAVFNLDASLIPRLRQILK